ncbi:MAG: hypothetical protein MRERV_44c003 [Mycoplasmataceae bacterium RV_VA103A]|nr:MAG: hypothetical protein MRERV_44c003 [Mycoplasmataceae bacterium RV_VA103A]
MPKVQEYINQTYPNKSQAASIEAKNQNLSGQLSLQHFPILEKIDLSNNKDLTSLELANLPKLKHLQSNNCQLINLIITNCPNLTYLNVGNNLLTKTDFLTNLNPEKLTYLSIHSNNFAKQKLDFLAHFTNLEELYLDNSNEENFDQRTYNHFYGSLKPLQNLTKLKWLSIAKTDIDSGLEYLPNSVKKIGLKKDWGSDNDGSCIKLARELKKASQVQGVTEKLIQEEENEPITLRGKATWYRLAPWHQAWNLLGEEEFKKQVSQQNAQFWLDKNYPKQATEDREKRENITFLNLNNKNLAGQLDLRDFTSLQSLSCIGNKLTNLDLSQCPNLIKINCSGNKFTNLDFLQEIPNPGKLEILRINKNEELKENLNFLTPFTNLKELNLEDCPLVGSLEPLKKMKNLKKIFLSRTHISKGLEYLPNSCRELYCDYDYQFKSIKIAEELSNFAEDKHYNLAKWREDKQNNTIASVIPLERLFVIRSNIKKFVNKWGKEEKGVSRLSQIQDPQQFQNQEWLAEGAQWVARGVAVTGGVLAATVNPVAGGVMAAASPVLEIVASQMKEKVYEKNKREWYEFTEDTEEFLDNYHELLGIVKSIKIGDLGIVNGKLKELKNKVLDFLQDYDENNNQGIEVEELINSRVKFNNELDKLSEIVKSMKQLEGKIIDYRQGELKEEVEVEKDEKTVQTSEQITSLTTYQKITEGIEGWWIDFKVKMNTPIQCWDCLECCQKKGKGKTKEISLETKIISEQKGESSLQVYQEISPKSN